MFISVFMKSGGESPTPVWLNLGLATSSSKFIVANAWVLSMPS